MIIAVAGKGGVGKSTIASLVIRYLIEKKQKPILAVDADPNSTLGEKLGIHVDQTVGGLRENMLENKFEAPAGVPKQRAVEYEVQQAVMEGSGFDLLVMGRGEGPGCYCSINNMLRSFLHTLTTDYRHVVVDNEAGMEHLSRRTNDKVDLMLVVSDTTPTGLKAARRVADLAREHNVVQGRMGLVLNRVSRAFASETATDITGLDIYGTIPANETVEEYELQSKPLLNMTNGPVVTAVNGMLERLGV